jgi:hypothetical protein
MSVTALMDRSDVLVPATTQDGAAPRRGRRRLQIALGVLWLLDGVLQLQPSMFSKSFAANILTPTAAGQPSLIGHPITWAAGLVSAHPVPWNLLFAATQLLIGIGILRRSTARVALPLSVVWAVAVWWLGEGLGMVLTGAASPLTGAPGAVIIYAVLALLAWTPAQPGSDPAIDRTLSRVAWLVVWCGSAVLWILPTNLHSGSVQDAISGATSGEPGWLSRMLNHAATAAGGHGFEIAVALAVISVVAGIGVFSRHPNRFVLIGVALSLVYWVYGQAFGGLLTGNATDPNVGPLLLLLGVAVIVSRPRSAAARVPVPAVASRVPVEGVIRDRPIRGVRSTPERSFPAVPPPSTPPPRLCTPPVPALERSALVWPRTPPPERALHSVCRPPRTARPVM